MADRFWVGGAGSWTTSSTTNWSATSGGASGASVPTVADSVFFDQAGTYIVAMSGALACLDITVSAGTVTFGATTSPTLQVRGSMTLSSSTNFGLAPVTFTAITTGKTVTANGASISTDFTFNGVGGAWTLGSALNIGNSGLNITNGTFDSGNYSITCGSIGTNNSNVRTINLGSSTVTITGGFGLFFNTQTNLTFNAGTSQINFSGASVSPQIQTGVTFYNVAFTSTSSGTKTIIGANTFNNFAVTAPSTAGITTVNFNNRQTINGTLSTTGTAGNRRVFFTTATYGISYDLVVNSAPSLTDADFRGLYVRGTAAPISGTRIGNRGECRGITFSTPKTVYWANASAGGNWSDNNWSDTTTGTPSTDFYPLTQDIATFTNSRGSGTIDANVGAFGSFDASARTTALTINIQISPTVYGNWTNGSGITFLTANQITFSGGTTQTITSAGRSFNQIFEINTYGGTVQLADALNIGTNALTVTNGTFTTAGYNVTTGVLSSSNSNVRTINLGASTVALSANTGQLEFATKTNLTFNAGTSNISITAAVGGSNTLNLNGLVFNNFTYTNNAGNTSFTLTITGANTFNNATFSFPSGFILDVVFQDTQTINGTLTCAGAAPAQRILLRSNTSGTPRTLTVNSISATDCDFRDITLAGAASGASPTRAGDCGGNTGITFPAPKTVYWNLAGTQNWDATGWATSSGGTPAANNFPLAQDTAVIDNTGVAGTVRITAPWNIGTFDASLRTSAMTFTVNAGVSARFYGDWKFGTGVTSTSTSGTINFSKNGTQTITSNGVQFGCNVTIDHPLANVQLADALSLNASRTLALNSGAFDAVTYNVTAGGVSSFLAANTLRMGSGTWTLLGTGDLWNFNTNPTIIAGTSNIILSDTSTNSRRFLGGGLYYNKLTIGGTTGTSTLTITGTNTFGELASTKTVAHTIIFPASQTTVFGKWAVTGTVGNVVTVNSSVATTAFTLSIAGPANSGIDYLSIRDCTVATTSPGEFYVGANSTNVSNNTRVIFTATPAPRTLYWVGGTGNWSSTTKWDTISGGGGGAAIPTSLDAVNFNSASNATAYTATIDAGVTLARCASFTMAGPASGNVTFAGSVGIAFHGNVSFAATGITRTYTGAMNWAGNGSYTFTTNGLTLASSCTVIGVDSTWTLGSALNIGSSSLIVTYGAFSTSISSYALTCLQVSSSNSNVRSISLNGTNAPISLGFSFSPTTNLTFSAGTSTVSCGGQAFNFNGGGQTFNSIIFTSTVSDSFTVVGANTFNTLSFPGRTSAGITAVTFDSNQTIGTLTLNAGTASAYRTFLASNTIGTQRTLNVTTLTAGAADIDFRDIAITGAAAPLTGTRFGDAKGNSGITFPAAKTVYWAQVGSSNWGSTGAGVWSATNGGTAANTEFPLAQDTAFIPFAIPNNNQTITVNAAYNIGTLDMNERNGSALVTLQTGTNTPAIYGNWINGTGTTISGSGQLTFAGRGSQTITSAGKTFTQNPLVTTSPGGSLVLADAFTATGTIRLTSGTLDANIYNVTAGGVDTLGALTRTLAIGSGLWSLSNTGSNAWNFTASTAMSVTGTGTISLIGASAKSFQGGGISYAGITLNQGGAGTLTITGNNTFKDITNTYSATGATTIALGATTQTLTSPWTATGAATRVLTVSGTSATLIFSGAGTAANVDYLNISNVRAYDLVDEWYAGPNSTNSGSLGWYFIAAGGTVYAVTITETGTGTDSVVGGFLYIGTVDELANSADALAAAASFRGVVSESGSGSDVISALSSLGGRILESATLTDTDLARLVARATLAETATGTDTDSARLSARSTISETATVTDTASAFAALLAAVIEAATITDLSEAIKGLFAYILESVTATDSINAPGSTYNPSLSESATATDNIVALTVFVAQIVEATTAADVVAAFKAYFSTVLETASGADLVAAQFTAKSIIAESATGTDVEIARSIIRPSVIETATGTDADVGRIVFPGNIAESATAADTESAKYTTRPNVAETATGTDAPSARATFRSSIIESSAVQDIVQAYLTTVGVITELATGADQVSALRALAAAIAEIASTTDTVAAKAIFRGILQELATAQDVVNAPGSTYSAPVVELATLLDAILAKATFPVSLNETATGTETVQAAFIPYAQITETATITDAASALAAFAARTVESAYITDEVSPPGSIYNPVVLAVAQMLDQVSPPGSVYNAPVLESATISDSLIGGFLWIDVNDDQVANWGDINNVQTTTWLAVDDSQTTNWQNVNNTQTSGWTDVNDTQTPGWTPILP